MTPDFSKGLVPAVVQNAETGKVLMLAYVLALRKEPPKSLLDLWKPAIIVLIPWAIIMLQPDLGTGIVFIGIFFGMLYWSGVAWPLLKPTAPATRRPP